MPLRIFLAVMLFALPAKAQQTFSVKSISIQNEKAVFATVESENIVSARARISGTVAALDVDEGDLVTLGQIIASVGDEKLALQIGAMDARINSLEAQLAKATSDLQRTRELIETGATSIARLDAVQAQFEIATSTLEAAISEREVIKRRVTEGDVLAPVAGRVLMVPLTRGSVVMPGEIIATIAESNFILRLSVPERHARYMNNGDVVRLEMGSEGEIIKVYPKIENGKVIADARVDDLGDYFVGERISVLIAVGQREAIIIPSSYIVTNFGIDNVMIKNSDGKIYQTPVQRGISYSTADIEEGVEILSGLYNDDVLVKP